MQPNMLMWSNFVYWFFFVQVFYPYFELHIALCGVLGLKEMSVNLTENVLVIFCSSLQCMHFL